MRGQTKSHETKAKTKKQKAKQTTNRNRYIRRHGFRTQLETLIAIWSCHLRVSGVRAGIIASLLPGHCLATLRDNGRKNQGRQAGEGPQKQNKKHEWETRGGQDAGREKRKVEREKSRRRRKETRLPSYLVDSGGRISLSLPRRPEEIRETMQSLQDIGS